MKDTEQAERRWRSRNAEPGRVLGWRVSVGRPVSLELLTGCLVAGWGEDSEGDGTSLAALIGPVAS